MRVLSLTLKFVMELAAFAAFGYWGASVGSGTTAVAFGDHGAGRGDHAVGAIRCTTLPATARDRGTRTV